MWVLLEDEGYKVSPKVANEYHLSQWSYGFIG
jgi:hypothetical protein